MFSAKHLKKGQIGENIACEYLVKKEWTIIKRNFRRKSDEIDIIAKSTDKTLIFIEVKAMTLNHGPNTLIPEDNLTKLKLSRITRACEFFARQYPQFIDPDKGWRIDLIAIDLSEDGAPIDIRHYDNI